MFISGDIHHFVTILLCSVYQLQIIISVVQGENFRHFDCTVFRIRAERRIDCGILFMRKLLGLRNLSTVRLTELGLS